jgi:hypothetical protein
VKNVLRLLGIYLLLNFLIPDKPLYAQWQQVVTVRTAQELQDAVAQSAIRNITKINVAADSILPFYQPLSVPRQLKSKGEFSRLIIDGQGAHIDVKVAMEYVIGRVMPDSQRMADDVYQSQAFTIQNFFINCKGLAKTGILMRATYHDYIAWCTVVGAIEDGISERFGMNAYIFQCETRSCGRYGISILPGDHPGAASNNAGSNMASAVSNRNFPKAGQVAGFACIRSGNTLLSGNISDFAVGQIPQREFLLDNSLSTTCKQITVDRSWSESEVTNCHYEVIGNGGTIDILRNYPQKGGTQVKVSGANYTQVNIEKWGNMLGKMQAATNNGVVFRFTNNGGSYDFANANNWVNAKLPISFYQEKFQTDQSWGFNIPSNRTLKLNSRNIIESVTLTNILKNYQLKTP